jgi:hypothetical protein
MERAINASYARLRDVSVATVSLSAVIDQLR